MKIRESINILSAPPEELPEFPHQEIEDIQESPKVEDVLTELLDKINCYTHSQDDNQEYSDGVNYGVSLVGEWVENALNRINGGINGPKI